MHRQLLPALLFFALRPAMHPAMMHLRAMSNNQNEGFMCRAHQP